MGSDSSLVQVPFYSDSDSVAGGLGNGPLHSVFCFGDWNHLDLQVVLADTTCIVQGITDRKNAMRLEFKSLEYVYIRRSCLVDERVALVRAPYSRLNWSALTSNLLWKYNSVQFVVPVQYSKCWLSPVRPWTPWVQSTWRTICSHMRLLTYSVNFWESPDISFLPHLLSNIHGHVGKGFLDRIVPRIRA